MQKLVAIDYLAESVTKYRAGWAIVAVDVIRATTTAITAAANGWRCFPAPTIEAALALSRKFAHPLLAGESGGSIPAGFEMDNSPAQLDGRSDTHRPVVLVSSSGTKVIHEAAGSEAIYLSCFRDYSFLSTYLAGRHDKVAIIGAGSLGEFREEDQACCAWIGAELMSQGYQAKNTETEVVVDRWRDQLPRSMPRQPERCFPQAYGPAQRPGVYIRPYRRPARCLLPPERRSEEGFRGAILGTYTRTRKPERMAGRDRRRVLSETSMDYATGVVILGSGHHGGLGIVRSLGRLGVPVYYVHASWWEPAFSSRYCRGRYLLNIESASPEEGVARLLEIGRKLGDRPILIPTTDQWTTWVADHAAALKEAYRFPSQDASLVRTLCDKSCMQDLARRIGIPTAQCGGSTFERGHRAVSGDSCFSRYGQGDRCRELPPRHRRD